MFKLTLPFSKKRSAVKKFDLIKSPRSFRTDKKLFSPKSRKPVQAVVKNPLSSKKREKNANKFKMFSIILSIILLIGIIIALFKSPFLLVKNINVNAENISCANARQIKQAAGLERINFLMVNQNAVTEKIKKAVPCVDRVKITKKFPDTVSITVSPRTAVAQVTIFQAPLIDELKTLEATSSSEPAQILRVYQAGTEVGTFQVDNSGLLFAQADDNSSLLKFALSLDGLSLGKSIDKNFIIIDKTIDEKFHSLNIDYKDIKFEQGTIYIQGSPTVMMSLDKDYQRQLAVLELILQKSKFDAIPVELVDLRFDKPVVKYAGRIK